MISIRLPWINPRLASRSDIEARPVLDLNRDFRAYLFSAAFRRHLAIELKAEVRSLDRKPELHGELVWRLYRAVRLLGLLATPLTPGERIDSYLHLLATGPHWYFRENRSWQYGASTDSLEDIGRYFADFLSARKIPTGEIVIEDPAQIPFARVFQQYLGGDRTPLLQTASEAPPLPKAAAYFAKHPDRLLKVTWSPQFTVTPKIRTYLRKLYTQGIPIWLEFSPVTDAEAPDNFVFEAMDEVLRMEPYIRQLTVTAPAASLADIVTVQLEAEFDDQFRLAPHRVRRVPVSPATRVKAAVPYITESRFDLAAISGELDPGKDFHPYRLGRGVPKSDAPTFARKPRASNYMVFPECPRAIPVSDEDSGYLEALAFFKRPRRVAEFAAQYQDAEQTKVLGFLENLVNLEVLKPV